MWAGHHNDKSAMIAIYDILELVDTKVEAKDLWVRNFDYSPDQICAVSNASSLIVSHDKKISILNFWKDRICPSRVFQPPPKMIRTRDSDSEFSSSDDSGTEEEEGN